MFPWDFNKYPHSNFHETDLDWLIRAVKRLEVWRKKIVDPFIKAITAWRTDVVDPFIEAFTIWKTTIVDPFIADITLRMLNVENALDDKQDKLTAGNNITIVNNVISATIPNASATVTGGIRTYWDSSTSTLYITDDGTDPTPAP